MEILRLHARRVTDEWMDAPNIEAAAHRRALAGLARINRISGTASKMAGAILQMARREKLTRLRILDVACGGGDVPVRVAGILRDAGMEVELAFMDRSETALSQASERARDANVTCATIRGDVRDGIAGGDFDVVTNSLFLHHLSQPEVSAVLAAMKDRARRMMVVSDLRRARMGWIAAWIGCHILSRSPMVRHDGPASVRQAWTKNELVEFARAAGMAEAKIKNCWPWRMLLTWERRHG